MFLINVVIHYVDCSNAQGYDTGIGGSTSTIVSPLGSPQPQLRSQVQRTNAAAVARYMQVMTAYFDHNKVLPLLRGKKALFMFYLASQVHGDTSKHS
ncbi:hypothetical protein FF38_14037 [Lucilia cuprina]|uniref:Uncharacterized protein n=1 Tax=Lucilia cuprina TaxID=7375 RepID=A0A0L0CNA4_LUCCU|nr:hypothetical protein FF38_14037 [Lucilia cuprina]